MIYFQKDLSKLIYYIIKIIITTLLIVFVSEIAKQSSLIAAVLASIPLVSVLAMIWLYIDTKDLTKIINLSNSIFWFVLPSLTLFITLPLLLKQGYHFYISISISIFITVLFYWLMVSVLHYYGIEL